MRIASFFGPYLLRPRTHKSFLQFLIQLGKHIGNRNARGIAAIITLDSFPNCHIPSRVGPNLKRWFNTGQNPLCQRQSFIVWKSQCLRSDVLQ